MAVKKINGKWYILGKIKKDDGSYYNYKKVAKNCRTANEARDYESFFKREYQDIERSKGKITFGKLCKEYLKNLTGVKQSTIKANKDILVKSYEALGKKQVNLINKKIMQDYIKKLEEKFSHTYVVQCYYTMNKVFKYAIENDYIKVNPLTNVKISVNKDSVRKEMAYWEPAEFKHFIEQATDEKYRLLFSFLYLMGCRRGEAMSLQWKDIDFEASTVKIYKTVTDKIDGAAWTITSPKTKNSVRTISMPKVLRDDLKEWKENQSKLYGFNEDRFIFGYDRPLSFSAVRKMFRQYIDATADENGQNAVKTIRIHDLRHSHASYLINNKSDKFTDFDIAKRLGDTVDMLHKTYAHWFKQADKGIIDFIDQDFK